MTVSPDARTPSASVHALSGSTPPGATVQPFAVATASAAVAEMPGTFAPLGQVAADVVAGLTARRAPAHPDATVIEFAGRVKALVEREFRLWDRRADVDDAVTRAMPPRPVRPEMRLQITSSEAIVDGARILTVTTPAGWREEHHAIEAAHAAALAEHEHIEAELGARLGLPPVEKLTHRASARLARWGHRLTKLAPRTQAGLKAKAAASKATAEGGMLLDPWRQKLATSVGDDALRIIGAEADARYRADQARDGELLALDRAWERKAEIHHAADEAMVAAWQRFCLIAPAVPEALFVSDQDPRRVQPYTSEHVQTKRRWYGDAASIEMLRQGYPKDLSDERRHGILAAYDGWVGEAEAAHREAGSNTTEAEAAETEANSEMGLARDAVMFAPARTMAGLQLKARVAVHGLGHGWGVEAIRRKLAEARANGDHLDEAAAAVLLDVALLPERRVVAPSMPRGGIEFPVGRYPAEVPREVIKSYRTFLAMELRFLDDEIYGRHEGPLHLWLDNPAGRLHAGAIKPAPSSRAGAVLGLLGLMPDASINDERIAEASAA